MLIVERIITTTMLKIFLCRIEIIGLNDYLDEDIFQVYVPLKNVGIHSYNYYYDIYIYYSFAEL